MSSPPSDNLAPPKSPIIRRRSLQLPHNLSVPIPPTLRQSPYLNSDELSIFQRAPLPLHTPTEEEEQWLQDTVPLALDHQPVRGGDRKGGRLSISSGFSTSDTSATESIQKTSSGSSRVQVRPQSFQLGPVPHSPPIDIWKHHAHFAVGPSSWRQHPTRVHSAPCIHVEVNQH